MKKLLLFLTIFYITLHGIEEIIDYNDDSVKYTCVDGYVKANITFTDGTMDAVKVVWVNPKENNKTVALKCEDFYIWINELEKR